MGHKKTIFHIDDEMEMHLLVELILRKYDYTLEYALSGGEALRRLASLQPDLILLDLAMPIMDGWDLRQRLKEFAHLADVPVVVVSAKLGSASVKSTEELEATGFLKKPFNPRELLDTVQGVLGMN